MSDEASESNWLAARFPGRSPEETMAWARRRLIGVIVAVLLVALVAGIVAGIVHGHGAAHSGDRSRRPRAPLPLEIASLLLFLVGAAVEVVGLLRMHRRGILRDNWRSPMLAASWRERRRVVAQVRGRRPAAPEDLPLARGAARRLLNQAENRLLYVGGIISLVALLLAARGVVLILLGLALVLFVVSIPFMLRDVRAARRFLNEHPVQ